MLICKCNSIVCDCTLHSNNIHSIVSVILYISILTVSVLYRQVGAAHNHNNNYLPHPLSVPPGQFSLS